MSNFRRWRKWIADILSALFSAETRTECPRSGALVVIAVVFLLFFWPATLTGQLLIFSDSLIYSYPLRVVAFDAIRHGSLPLWTPAILSGYPLLSMAQLGVGYPLTWFYLVFPGYWAEQIYVLVPYLLAPAFTYAYLRQIGGSRPASLLAGLSFTYGGMMAGGLAHNGMFTNAVMWLPLMLIVVERARTGRFALCLLGVAGAYSMSVLTGIGQAFLYTGLVALAYAAFISLVVPPDDSVSPPHGSVPKLRTWRPLIVCAGGMALAAGVAAFQILETLRAQRRSIRSELTYEVFSGGGFAPWQTVKAFFAPYHHLNWEATPTINLLAGLLAVVAIVAALRAPARHRRTFFWIGLALLGWLLMLGDHTPLYRLAYHVPVFNRFRLPWRHAFEWSFAVSVLAAFGLDALRKWDRLQPVYRQGQTEVRPTFSVALFVSLIVVGVGWWIASDLRMAAGEALLKNGDSTQYVTLTQPAWLAWKIGFALLALLTIGWCWQLRASRFRGALLALAVISACCLEAFMLVSVWWFPYARPSAYFQTVPAATQFLKERSLEHSRIYTSAVDYSQLNREMTGMFNLSALYGFQNAAGYEPLMLEKYNRAFEGRWSFHTPWFGAPTDPQILSPRWQVLNLLNTRFLVEFSTAKTRSIEKDGVPFPAIDIAISLTSGASAPLTGSATAVDSLSIVSALANSNHLAQNETVAQIVIHTADGRRIQRELKAGRDTAEWAHERPDVKPNIKHKLAPVFDSLPGDAENGIQANWAANRYWSRIELGDKVSVDRVEITNVAPIASLAISKAALYESSTRKAVLLTRRLPDHWQKVHDHDDVRIYENPHAMPRAWLTAQAEAVSSDEALRRIRGHTEPGMGEKTFDPKVTTLLEAPPEKLAGLNAMSFAAAAEARITNYTPNQLIIETKADKPSVLVASEINYPGWEATVDGRRTDIYAANYLLRGIILPAGEHRVEMRYLAPAARNGAVISGLSLLVMIGLLFTARRK
ncbi:MAG TPA: YfhO family protein [Blastocatellia bacterium]